MDQNKKLLVDIVLPTYNQENYIKCAIQSILDQNCDFGFRIIIGEDCSTDGTRQICESFAKRFPDKILLLKNEKNLGLVRNYENVFSQCISKYIAILEGDDYWIDSLKLQKQVDILESNISIGLIHTGSYTLTEKGTLKINHLSVPRRMLEGDLYETLLVKRNTISPMTVLFRKELIEKYIDFNYFIKNEFKTIDYPLWLAISRNSEIAYIAEPTAVYRALKKSVSRPGNFEDIENFFQTSLKCKKYYFQKYPVSGLDENSVLSNTYSILAEAAFIFGRIDKAKDYADRILIKNFKNRFLKLAVTNRVFHRFFKLRLGLLPFFSDIKQVLYKLQNSN